MPHTTGRKYPARARRLVVLAALLGLVALALPGRCLAAREERADLTFIKLEETRFVAGRDMVCEWYTVDEDDVLWKIYRERSRVDLGGYHRWSKEVAKLNPHIDNLNLIYPGQKILIPVRDAAPGDAERSAGGAHRVVKGDTVVGILRRMGLPYRIIFNEYLDMVKALNPEIKDLNLIYPGQVVRVPAYEPGRKAEPSTVAARAAREEAPRKGPPPALARREAPKPEPAGREAPSPPQAIESGAKDREKEDLPLVEEWRRNLADMVGEVAVRIGGRYTDEGRHYIPLYQQGQVNLDARLFPLIEFDRNVRVILDLKGRLPKDLVKALSGKYRRYQIVVLDAGETARTLLEKVLVHLGSLKKSSAQELYTVSRSIGIEAVADWVLEMEEIPGLGRHAALISLAGTRDEVTDQDLASFLHAKGVDVVDVIADEGSDSYQVFAGKTVYDTPAPRAAAMDYSSPAEVASSLLKLLDIPYESGRSLDLKSGDEAGFSITVDTEVLFNSDGTDCIVDYGRLSPSLVELLKKNGYSPLILPPDIEVEENIREILRFLGYDLKHILRLSSGTKPDGRGITVTVTGMIFKKEGTTTWMITFLEPHPGLNAFLKSRNLTPIFIKPAAKK